jgi:hypothetical protein
VQEFFAHEQDVLQDETDEAPNDEISEGLTELQPEPEMVQTEPEPMYFEEDAAAMDAVEEMAEAEASSEIMEEDTIDDIEEKEDQGEYFTREAGVDKKNGKQKSKGSLSMGFYEDK